MKWFLALNRHSPGFPLYADLVRVAVHTAREHSALQPHLLYDGPDDPLLHWLDDHGVEVIRRRSFLYDSLRTIAARTGRLGCLSIGAGAFLRLELPALAAQRGWDDECVLYTDCDVMFLADPLPALRTLAPRYFAAAREDRSDRLSLNSGVMLMNLPALRRQDGRFRRFVTRHLDHFTRRAWDQDAYRAYYSTRLVPHLELDERVRRRTGFARRRRWTEMPLELNWRPYWGANPAAAVVHFHGPKPQQEPYFRVPEAERPAELASLAPLATDCYHEMCERWRAALNECDQPARRAVSDRLRPSRLSSG
jgi:hypothetical protein